eukprot:6902431-Karenia_brevis.AAC.1
MPPERNFKNCRIAEKKSRVALRASIENVQATMIQGLLSLGCAFKFSVMASQHVQASSLHGYAY